MFKCWCLPRGLGRPNSSRLLFLAEPPLPGQTDSKHFGNSFSLFLSSSVSFFSPLLILPSSKSLFFISWGLFGSILGVQDDPPTLIVLGFVSTEARFLQEKSFRSEDGLASVLGLSWASFGCSWGSLGGLFGSPVASLFPLRPSARLFLFYLLRSRCVSSFGASSGRFGVSKMTLRPSFSLISSRRELDFR